MPFHNFSLKILQQLDLCYCGIRKPHNSFDLSACSMCKQHLTLGCREAGLPIVSGAQFHQFTIVGHHTEQLLQSAQLELSLRHGGLLRAERTQGWMCLILGLSLSSAITDESLKSFHFSDSPAQRSQGLALVRA